MNALYVLAPTTNPTAPPPAEVERAQVLGCTPAVGTPGVSVYPSVVVTSPALAAVVIADTLGQATATQVETAKQAALAAEATRADKIGAALTALQAATADLAPGLAEGQQDLATLAARPSTTVLAQILHRVITREMVIAQGIGDLLVALELVEPTVLPTED